MGNQSSSSSTNNNNNNDDGGTRLHASAGNSAQQAFRKILQPNNNALGLSRAELDERCRPSGLYASCHWDEKAIRRLVGDGKLAARLKGSDDAADLTYRECPICFFNYSEINVAKCCHALICTECYLQIKPQKSNCKNKQGKIQHNCPFCNAARLHVAVAGPYANEVATGALSEQAVSPDQPKIQIDNDSNDGRITPPPTEQSPHKPISTPPTSGFGSHLEKNARVAMMRARSSSLSESQSSNLQSPVQEISSLAMTPEERRALESEVRAQHNHPLALRLEQEEAERRMRNEYEYYQQRSASSSNRRTIADVRRQGGTASPRGQQPPLPSRGPREWGRLMDAFEHQRTSNVGDLAVLEAALMMNMQEESRRRGVPPSHVGHDFSLDAQARVRERLAAAFHQATLSEEEQLAMAIAASLRESNNNSNHDTNADGNQENNGNGSDDGSDA